MNNEIKINDGDLIFFFRYNILISLFINFIMKLIIIIIRFGIIHKKFGIRIIIIIVLNQFSFKFKNEIDGSKILNKFIIIFVIFIF